MITRVGFAPVGKLVLDENWNSRVVWMLQVVLMSELPPLPTVPKAMFVWRAGRTRRRRQTSVTAFPGNITYLYMTNLNTGT